MSPRLLALIFSLILCLSAFAKAPNAANPPTIQEQPIGRVVTSNAPVTLSVIATGTPPVTYQWFNGSQVVTNNARVSGATNAVLNIEPALVADTSSNYFAVVTAAGASSTSTVVSITVLAPLQAATPIGGTGVLVNVLGQRGDVYRIESRPDIFTPYNATNGFATNFSGVAAFMDRLSGQQRFYRGVVERVLPVMIPPGRNETQAVIRAYGRLNQTWRLEATTNFLNWTNLATITNTTGWMRFSDTNAPRPGMRFYRVSPP